jgi:predicted nucleic-acid-binding Zn-ribbon protein
MNQFVPCPKCQNNFAEPIKFTLWGGVLGPKIFTHVKCQSCGSKYNGKTGQSNTTNIIIYTLVAGIIAAVFFFFISLLINL